MASMILVEQLDQAVGEVIAHPYSTPHVDREIAGLVEVAAELRCVARESFRSRLRADLEEQAHWITAGRTYTRRRPTAQVVEMPKQVMPSLFGEGCGSYPVHRVSFMTSVLAHTAAVALMLASGFWLTGHRIPVVKHQMIPLVTESPYVLPPAANKAGGGGGGGERDLLSASKGALPKFAPEQVTPPSVVVRNVNPRLAVEPTVVAPPNVKLPQTGQLGDPMSAILGPLSNGRGSGGGIGNGEGGGIGTGHGPGVGPGWGGGIGGAAYRVGGGVSAPRAIYDPDPEYSEEARKAKYQGTVVLWVVIDAAGNPRDIKVARSLGMGLDQKAVEAVRGWRFTPAMKDGRPVAVQVNIEVNFRLY